MRIAAKEASLWSGIPLDELKAEIKRQRLTGKPVGFPRRPAYPLRRMIELLGRRFGVLPDPRRLAGHRVIVWRGWKYPDGKRANPHWTLGEPGAKSTARAVYQALCVDCAEPLMESDRRADVVSATCPCVYVVSPSIGLPRPDSGSCSPSLSTSI